MNADRNLLFGILAVERKYISDSQFLAASRAWLRQRQRPLAELRAKPRAKLHSLPMLKTAFDPEAQTRRVHLPAFYARCDNRSG
jgi:hypothetical protein